MTHLDGYRTCPHSDYCPQCEVDRLRVLYNDDQKTIAELEDELEAEMTHREKLSSERCERIAELEAENDALKIHVHETLGWMYAEACSMLDRGEDLRQVEVPDLMMRWLDTFREDEEDE